MDWCRELAKLLTALSTLWRVPMAGTGVSGAGGGEGAAGTTTNRERAGTRIRAALAWLIPSFNPAAAGGGGIRRQSSWAVSALGGGCSGGK